MNKNRQTITDHYTTHRNELLAYVSSRLGNHAEAEDVVQSVYLRLLMMEKRESQEAFHQFPPIQEVLEQPFIPCHIP